MKELGYILALAVFFYWGYFVGRMDERHKKH